jgi:hypothetical protein
LSFITNLFSGSVGSVIDSVGKAIDSVVTSDEERGKLRNELEAIKAGSKIKEAELENAYEQEISNRWVSDNSGNFFTKSIRPLTLIYILLLITCMIFGDMLGLIIDDKYIALVEVLSVTVFGAFFGGKTIERYKNRIVG